MRMLNGKIYLIILLVGIVSGAVGGLILSLSALFLSIIIYLENKSFHGLEVVFIITAFIFFTIAAHFLDLAEKERIKNQSRKFAMFLRQTEH